tara:strand:- start:3603 stop:4895 length:1293 start_codon:yes stop_codon:yes gene_type:complete
MSVKEYHAFSSKATNYTIKLSGNKLPIMLADHSVIYLPMEDGEPYVIFSGADTWDKRKGIKETAKTILNGITDKGMGALKKADETLMKNLQSLIIKNTGPGKLFTYKTGTNAKNLFKKTKWHTKLDYNYVDGGMDSMENEFILECLNHCRKALSSSKNLKKVKTLLKKSESDCLKEMKAFVKKGTKGDKERGYYILQVPGAFLDTQPYGGFKFTDGRSDVYKSAAAFGVHIDKYLGSVGSRVYGTEMGGHTCKTQINESTEPSDDVVLWHGSSKGPSVDDLKSQLNGKKILLSDTNMTQLKIGKSWKTISKEIPDYYVLSSNFKVTKSRDGGPFFNSQIYKSEPGNNSEIDGMVIIFDESLFDKVDKKELKKMLDTNCYKLHKGGVERAGRRDLQSKSKKKAKKNKSKKGGWRKTNTKKQNGGWRQLFNL